VVAVVLVVKLVLMELLLTVATEVFMAAVAVEPEVRVVLVLVQVEQ
jgi:hypothetical protein